MEDKTIRSAEDWAKIDAGAPPTTASAESRRSGTSGGMTALRVAVLIFLCAYSFGMGQIPANGLNGFGKVVAYSFFLVAPALYFLPAVEAALREQPNITSIVLVNTFLGWTLIGWVAAMAWACKSQPVTTRPDAPLTPWGAHNKQRAQPPTTDRIGDLTRLSDLKDRGVLTQAEFDREKAQILARP